MTSEIASPPLEQLTPPRRVPHPLGLYTLFFTEMWERFSYYGMRALLVLFMTNEVTKKGMGLTDEVANSIYGLYTAAAYLACLPGGWIADRILGARKAVWYGGIIIAAGHFTMAIHRPEAFFLGLVLVASGTGLLKPNISALVGGLYPEGGTRRDAGFTIFYMGINLGAFAGPLICGTLGEKYDWHLGFASAGIGMVLGLTQYKLSSRLLGEAGQRPESASRLSGATRFSLAAALGLAVLIVGLTLAGVIKINPVVFARFTSVFIVSVGILYFVGVLAFAKLEHVERTRVFVIVILFFSAALFWAGFEQAGSSFNLFAERYTDRVLGFIHFEIPATWFQSLGPVFVITLAPVAAAIWTYLARRHLNPSIPLKFGLGLLLLAAGFVVMAVAAKLVVAHNKVLPVWLITTYLVHTFGELCLSPVGLSSVTKLAPQRFVGQMMGTWFLAASLGSLVAGLLAGMFKADAVSEMPSLYLRIGIIPTLLGILLILIAKPIHRWTAGID